MAECPGVQCGRYGLPTRSEFAKIRPRWPGAWLEKNTGLESPKRGGLHPEQRDRDLHPLRPPPWFVARLALGALSAGCGLSRAAVKCPSASDPVDRWSVFCQTGYRSQVPRFCAMVRSSRSGNQRSRRGPPCAPGSRLGHFDPFELCPLTWTLPDSAVRGSEIPGEHGATVLDFVGFATSRNILQQTGPALAIRHGRAGPGDTLCRPRGSGRRVGNNSRRLEENPDQRSAFRTKEERRRR